LVGGGSRGPSEVIRWETALRDFEPAVDRYGVNRDRDGRSQTTLRVRFAPKSGQGAHVLPCPPCANSGLTHQAECAEFIAERKVDVERLFTHRWRLEQAEEAYRLFDTQTTGKAMILPS
jgi:hypothetical protein